MQFYEFDQEKLNQIKSNLQQYSKQLSIMLSVCLIIIAALISGFHQIEILSIKFNFHIGSIFGFIIVCFLLIYASSAAKNTDELIEEEISEIHAKGVNIPEDYRHKRLMKLNKILLREPNLFNPLSIEDEGPINGFIMLFLVILIPPFLNLVVQYISINYLFTNGSIFSNGTNNNFFSMKLIEGISSGIVNLIFIFSWIRLLYHTQNIYIHFVYDIEISDEQLLLRSRPRELASWIVFYIALASQLLVLVIPFFQ